MSNVLVLVETLNKKVKKAAFAGITMGQEVAKHTGGELHLVLIGQDVAGAAEEVKAFGAKKIYVVEGTAFANYLAESYTPALQAAHKASGATVVAASSTSLSKDMLPRFAARVGAGMASDVLLVIDGKTFTRPMWAGNITATVKINTSIAVCTVRATEFAAPAAGSESSIEKLSCDVDLGTLKTQYLRLKEIKSERPDVTSAARVVSGGRGVKSPEGFKLVEQLADKLNAGVGASRAVCDAGWVTNDLQIGQTGKVVAPSLYIAVGISGAIQHLAGMKGSKIIVAINKDADAPIFQVADYGLVADLFTVVPEIIAQV
jgi:electron transfer flavoprotein alpha subunit